jgi:regulatory protein
MTGEVKKAFNAACKLLAVRDRSVFEVRAALEKKQLGQSVVEGAVAELLVRKLLDDEKFAVLYAESLVRHKKAGPRYISAALAKKGIAAETATKAVMGASDPRKQDAAVKEWIERKSAAKKKNDTLEKRKKRIYDFLLRRGFPPELVMKNIRDLR